MKQVNTDALSFVIRQAAYQTHGQPDDYDPLADLLADA